jgi:hypothetical protein
MSRDSRSKFTWNTSCCIQLKIRLCTSIFCPHHNSCTRNRAESPQEPAFRREYFSAELQGGLTQNPVSPGSESKCIIASTKAALLAQCSDQHASNTGGTNSFAVWGRLCSRLGAGRQLRETRCIHGLLRQLSMTGNSTVCCNWRPFARLYIQRGHTMC